MRIKHAYNTLLNSESRKRYETGNQTSDYSYSTARRNQSWNTQDEEEFYGFGKKIIWSILFGLGYMIMYLKFLSIFIASQ